MTDHEEPTPEILTESGSSDYRWYWVPAQTTNVVHRIDLDHRFDIDDPEETP